MKNADKLRKFLLGNGCKLTYDGIFKDEKFYFVIKGEREGGSGNYSPAELAFGKDSIGSAALKEFAAIELAKSEVHLAGCANVIRREEIIREIELFKEVLK